MKKIIIALILLCASTSSYAANEQYKDYNGGLYYISSFSSAAIYKYFSTGEKVSLAKLTGDTVVYCGISTLSDPTNLLTQATVNNGFQISITASSSDMYLGACVKTSGTSGGNIVSYVESDSRSRRTDPQAESDPEAETKLLEYIKSLEM